MGVPPSTASSSWPPPATASSGPPPSIASARGELIPILSRPIFAEPGTFGFMTQPSLFGRGVGGGRTIELNISGHDLDDILGVAGRAAGIDRAAAATLRGPPVPSHSGARTGRAGGPADPRPSAPC